jgi:hypothetical protein
MQTAEPGPGAPPAEFPCSPHRAPSEKGHALESVKPAARSPGYWGNDRRGAEGSGERA